MNDGAAISGTIEFAKSSTTVVGSSTDFLTEVSPGDEIYAPAGLNNHAAGVTKLKVKSIETDESLTLVEGPDSNDGAGTTAHVRKPPVDLTTASPHISGTNIFGIAADEVGRSAATDKIVAISMATGGSGYPSAPAVSFTSTGGSSAAATAVVGAAGLSSAGKLTSFTVTNVGSGYSAGDMTVVVAAPTAHTFDGASDVDSNQITLAAHSWETGDAATYADGGGDDITIAEHTDDNGTVTAAGNLPATVYIIVDDGNTIKVAPTNSAAKSGDNFVLTDGTGASHTLTGETATGTAILGLGGAVDQVGTGGSHTGWVKRTVGSGGRAGRVQYECLVAASSITGDFEDIATPE